MKEWGSYAREGSFYIPMIPKDVRRAPFLRESSVGRKAHRVCLCVDPGQREHAPHYILRGIGWCLNDTSLAFWGWMHYGSQYQACIDMLSAMSGVTLVPTSQLVWSITNHAVVDDRHAWEMLRKMRDQAAIVPLLGRPRDDRYWFDVRAVVRSLPSAATCWAKRKRNRERTAAEERRWLLAKQAREERDAKRAATRAERVEAWFRAHPLENLERKLSQVTHTLRQIDRKVNPKHAEQGRAE